ncbi:hypothetical protein N7463_004700 [Penicillium fimorum]|uniref:Uncharacterized protein n=1 Tax=Penicillium fimorum TaxID=1882269 RepID=A0A9X0CAH7_9EURO|nr:hypothetical protein N7463_004700 [Penicillium fimorum]
MKAGFLPGYPENPTSPVLASDFEGRELIEISFENGLEIGGFRAHDYFGDGSFYLLDSPGHCAGHLSALARTTSSSAEGGNSFVFLGGEEQARQWEFSRILKETGALNRYGIQVQEAQEFMSKDAIASLVSPEESLRNIDWKAHGF